MNDEWYVARRGPDGNKRYGPVPLRQLRDMMDEGKVRGEDLVWRDGMAKWQRADQCDALFPPAPPPPRGPRDYPPDDRRDYARRPRRYGPDDDDDDRPYRRRYRPPQSSSNGPLVGLLVGGGVLAVLVLGCGGLGLVSYLTSRAAVSSTGYGGPTMPFAPPADEEDGPGDAAMANFGGGAFNPGQALPPYGQSVVYYTNNVQLGEAKDIGDYLSDDGYFPEDRGVTVQVDKDLQGTYRVRFCLKDGAAWKQGTVAYFTDLRADLEKTTLPGKTVEFDLCDGNLNTVRTIRAGD